MTQAQIEVACPGSSEALELLVTNKLVSTCKPGRSRLYGVARIHGQRATLRAALQPRQFIEAVRRALRPASLTMIWPNPEPCSAADAASELLYHSLYPEPEVGLCAWALEELTSLGQVRVFPSGDVPWTRYLPIDLSPDAPHPLGTRRGYAAA